MCPSAGPACPLSLPCRPCSPSFIPLVTLPCSFTFDYDTRHVDYATEVHPLPEVCGPLLSRALASLPKDLVPAAPDQLTINEYTP
jgi:hypothetical protein